MKTKAFILLFVFGSLKTMAQIDTTTQLYINQDYSNVEMISDFFDDICVELSNVSFTGTDDNAAFFDAGNTDLGLNFGIVLSTGSVSSIPFSTFEFSSSVIGIEGDTDLNNLSSPYQGYDAVVLEFDFVALETETIFFEYVFASEEYPEYVGSSFNDVFAFFVTDANGTELINRSLIPGSVQPVSINTINSLENSNLHIPYDAQGGNFHVFDGMTVPLPAIFTIEAGAEYSVKIGIQDVSDGIFDSGVFIGVGSLCSEDLLEPIPDFLVELQDSLSIKVTNNSLYSSSMYVDFGDGNFLTTAENEVFHTYAIAGEFELETIAMNSCCNANQLDDLLIGDPVNAEELDSSQLVFSPNPVDDELMIDLKFFTEVDVSIYDLSGREVLSHRIHTSSKLDVSGLEKGIYTLLVKSKDYLITEQLVKN